ncbi:MAG: polysaccharide biosynthesis tyrosine autokinase [Ruminococcus sp.]|nr:polysaccharide biosynthesis tyrosine autokinase [Ruminococcus sp.]
MNKLTIKDFIKLLMGKIWLILFFMIIGGVAAFCYSKFMLPLQYESHITMYVQSYTNVNDNTNNNNNVNNITNSKQLVNTYMEVLKDDAVMDALGERLMDMFDQDTISSNFTISNRKIVPSSIRKTINVTSVADTSALKLSVVTKNPNVSAAVCNALTVIAPKFVQDAVGVGSINTIDKARVYNNPVGPNVKKNAILGAAAAFFLIVFLIFMFDFFDNTIKESDMLGNKYKKAILGEVNRFDDPKKRKGGKKDVDSRMLISEPQTPFYVSESYKSIRTNVMFAMGTSDNKIVVVSSPNPSDGKSTTAANIAIAFAQTDSRVLLIDADMRKPVQHKTFKVKNIDGLSTLIIKKSETEKCIKENVVDGLDLLPSGPTPPNPSELLASENFAELLNQFSIVYDYIIIDTPPINVVSDALVMKNLVNGIFLVVKHGKTTFDEVDNSMKQLDLAKANMLGFVMNEIEQNRHSSYYKSKYDYSYGESSNSNKKDSEIDVN